jgi:hypothetical protein
MPIGEKTASEVLDEMFRNEERLAKQVFVKDKVLVINVKYEYRIELSRCDTHEKILAWAVHLSEKNWMDMDVLMRFIYVACKENNLKITQP